ncbi:MAG: branched-chain amino acid ABC transporter permease [Lentisphaeria bacterium]|nr:branched-chain amino acid ABC transporter permease [Lentisphaeria bacterium]NQZ67250.1 branched-chain amino acid ABC transporter permease [Lentisphaeria bacterium]
MDYWVEIINLIGIYAILALSLNVICGMTGQLHLGHAGFFAIGAYASGLVSIYIYNPAMPGYSYMTFIYCTLAAIIACTIAAIIIGLPCLRLGGDYLAIATLGFGEIVRMVFQNLEFTKTVIDEETGNPVIADPSTGAVEIETFGGATGIELPEEADLVHYMDDPTYDIEIEGSWYSWSLENFENFQSTAKFFVVNTWFIWLFVLITFVLLYNMKKSAMGRAFLAIRTDEIAAKSMGIHLPRYKLASFIIAAVFAGLAGSLYAHMQTMVAPTDFTLLHTITMLLIVVLGGLGSLTGSLIAAVILVSMPYLLSFLPNIPLGNHSISLAEKKELIFAILLILLIRFVPNGIMGLKEFTDFKNPFRKKSS